MTSGSPVGGAGLAGPGAADPSGVRERLTEAAVVRQQLIGAVWSALIADDLVAAWPAPDGRRAAEAALAAVLPLIADEIEALAIPGRQPIRVGYGLGVRAAAALVRSWAADGAR